jgi:hypothetical protein
MDPGLSKVLGTRLDRAKHVRNSSETTSHYVAFGLQGGG